MRSGFSRIVVILVAAIAAFALGRWTGSRRTIAEPQSTVANAPAETPSAPVVEPSKQPAAEPEPVTAPAPVPSRSELLLAEVEEIADAARVMSTPDARTYGFFEHLRAEDLDQVVEFIESLPSGNEQDALFTLAMKRWAQLDGPAALRRASAFPQLGTRVEASAAVYQEWAAVDAGAALLQAANETDDGALRRAVSAALVGAATANPSNAFSLLELAPVKFLQSPAAKPTVERMVTAAYGTGNRDALRTVIDRMRPGEMRTLMIDTLARNWGAHFPADAYDWVKEVLPEGDERGKVVQDLFTAIAFKDPSLAAEWVVEKLKEPERTDYLAAAVSQWAQLDLRGVEIWLNEQPEGLSIDGGSYALASHFIKEGHLPRAFSWIRRISQDEMRIKMFADLGRLWSQQRPEEFKRFLDETSLNRAEVELLTADVKPSS